MWAAGRYLGHCMYACILSVLAVGVSGRTISGTISWQATAQRVSGAIVKAYDNDPIGREFMGQSAVTTSTGAFSIWYDGNKNWDTCCFSATNPDIVLEVWIGSTLWLTTGETSNVDSDRSFSLALTTRTISGTVTWGGTNERVSGAVVYAYDNDPVGREYMGQATTSSTGSYIITYNKNIKWDTCCFDGIYPDIVAEVWWGGAKWFTSVELSNRNGDAVVNIVLTRIIVSGTAYWQETCQPASGLTVAVKDDDTIGSETMGTGATGLTGSYAVSVNYKQGGTSDWDLCCGSDTNPDIFTEFVWGGSSKGKTPVTSNLAVTYGSTRSVVQGTSWVWRGDVATGASATQSALKLDTVDWIEVEEYNSCTPRQVRVSILVNFQREGSMTDAMWAKLKTLARQGIAENWSRTGARAVRLSNGLMYDVVTVVVDSSSGKNVELEYVTGKDYKRSNNVGSVAFFDFDPIIYYNQGYFSAQVGAAWEATADYNFKETAGHEFGHSILRESAPASTPIAWFGIIPLTRGQSWSWTHKGTSSVLQDVLKTAPYYPATGDWDLMLYYQGSAPAGAYDRSFAVEDDVRRMVGIAKVKRARSGACACPLMMVG